MNSRNLSKQNGSVELLVLGLLAALIVVLALPLLSEVGSSTDASQRTAGSVNR